MAQAAQTRGGHVPPEWTVSEGLVPYEVAAAAMESRVAAIHARTESEQIWLLEHPALFTAGTSARAADLLEPNRLPVFRTGRGGQYTYHGPGQRIAYVMLDLARRQRAGGPDLRAFVRGLEQWLIDVLDEFGVRGERREGRVGVWVDLGGGKEAKIAALGIRLRRWVTFHGVSLNVDPDLTHYDAIIPCGVKDYGVTSLAALGIEATMEQIDAALRRHFEAVFRN